MPAAGPLFKGLKSPAGELAERSNAAVLKTASPEGLGGSNPSLSAKPSQQVPPSPKKAVSTRSAILSEPRLFDRRAAGLGQRNDLPLGDADRAVAVGIGLDEDRQQRRGRLRFAA